MGIEGASKQYWVEGLARKAVRDINNSITSKPWFVPHWMSQALSLESALQTCLQSTSLHTSQDDKGHYKEEQKTYTQETDKAHYHYREANMVQWARQHCFVRLSFLAHMHSET